VNWLKSFTRRTVGALASLNRDLVLDQIAALSLFAAPPPISTAPGLVDVFR